MKLPFFFLPGMLGLLMVSIACAPATEIPTEKQCSGDSDCLPAQCCHPKDAVSKNSAPNCQGLLCTQECVSDTIDCGQGEIKCVEGGCKVVMKV